MTEEHALICALLKIYDSYITPLRSSVFCWKWPESEHMFIAGMTVTQFNGTKRYLTYYIPMEHWPKFNVAIMRELPEMGNPDERIDILMNL